MKHLTTKAIALLSFISLLLFLTEFAYASPASPGCGDGIACEIEGRSYQVKTPDKWDGKTSLPVLIFFHGWGRTGRNVMNNTKITSATENNGFLLVAPDGLGKSWDFWGDKSRDTAFAKSIIVDLGKQWSIDSKQIYISGFSYGGAMAWRLACESGAQFAGILPIAGTLWQQDTIQCKGGSVNITQVHGLKDNVMRLPRGDNGDPLKGVELWRRTNKCSAEPDVIEKIDIFTCYRWTGCNSGKDTAICLHIYGHMIPKGWLELALAEVLKANTNLNRFKN